MGVVCLPIWVALSGGALHVAYDNDSAMRLVQVRDLLAGQPWFDLTQHRMGLGEGTPMHWSRLVDGPIALLLLLLAPLLGGMAEAETAAAVIWPTLVAVPAIAAAVATANRLGGPMAGWAGAAISGFVLIYSGKYVIGAFDHHNVQITLLLVAVAFAVRFEAPRAAAWLGIVCALAVAVGVEILPHVAVVCGAAALWWAMEGVRLRRSALAFTGSFVASLATVFALSAPREAWAGGFCDALSRDLAVPAVIASGLLGLAALRLSDRGRVIRLAALAGCGVTAIAGAALVAPACLSAPYDNLDPFLEANWLDNVVEARSLFEAMADNPKEFLALLLPGLIGLGSAVAFFLGSGDRGAWGMLCALILVALAISLWQVRGTVVLGALSVPATACAVAWLSGRVRVTGRPWPGLGAILLFMASVPAVTILVAGVRIGAAAGMEAPAVAEGDASPMTHDRCVGADRLAPLAQLPAGLVAASANLGPHILLQTDHRVLAGPYHRNEAGMIAQLRIGLGRPEVAGPLLRESGATYVAVCNMDPEFAGPGGAAHEGLYPRLVLGYQPEYLDPVEGSPFRFDDGTELRVFRVRETGNDEAS